MCIGGFFSELLVPSIQDAVHTSLPSFFSFSLSLSHVPSPFPSLACPPLYHTLCPLAPPPIPCCLSPHPFTLSATDPLSLWLTAVPPTSHLCNIAKASSIAKSAVGRWILVGLSCLATSMNSNPYKYHEMTFLMYFSNSTSFY